VLAGDFAGTRIFMREIEARRNPDGLRGGVLR